MKKIFALFVASILALGLLAQTYQSKRSNTIKVNIQKETIPALLNIVPGTWQFIDQNGNRVVDANEHCKIRFMIVNEGRGDGYGCVVRVTAKGSTQGITFKNITLPLIPTKQKYMVEIPIIADANTITGEMELNIYVDEPNGFGTEPIQSTIGTHKLQTPYVNVVSYKILGPTSGILERRKVFNLQIIVQNTDQGEAEDVQVALQLPKNVNRVGGEGDYVTIASLKAGESRMLEYELIANQEAEESLSIDMKLSERSGMYAADASIPITFGQHLGGSMAIDVQRRDQDVDIQIASLISDVDENIPVSNTKNNNTFAVIIANENYQSVADVPYALNDGNIFHQYCLKTLGIPEKQIRYVPNATGNQIRQHVGWLQNVTKAYSNANIIFYYAGHGIPDESSHTAYLLPVDGSGMDVTTGYKLDDLYATLGNIPAKNVTVFMDACFSGSKREDGMLVSARGVAIKSKSGVPQGNMVVFSAAQGDETAYPNHEEKHGMFTYFLLKKLQDTKGDVTLFDLGQYIKERVSQESIVLNNKLQTPCVTPSTTLGTSWHKWKLK